MTPPVTRWLCLHLVLLLTQGVRCQLSVGGVDSFLVDDLDATAGAAEININDLVNTTDAEVAQDAGNYSSVTSVGDPAAATNKSQEETTLPDFDDDLADGLEVTTEFGGLSNDEFNKRTGAMDYEYSTGLERKIDDRETGGATSAIPQLTRRIVFSGGDTLTPTVPEPSVAFTRPSSVVRVLSDDDRDMWLPNWPSQLLDNDSRPARRPTIRFPTDPLPSVFPLAPASSVITPVPSIVPSFTVSKVPVTQYFFDLTSVAPTPVPGPLFDQDDLSTPVSAMPSGRPDLSRPVIDLSSSISDLQSSALIEAARPFSVTPSLFDSHSSVMTKAEVNFSSHTLAATPVLDLVPNFPSTSTVLNGTAEGEVVVNNVDGKLNTNNVTFVTEEVQDLEPETTGLKPPMDHPTSPGDDIESTTAGEVPVDESFADPDVVVPGIDELQLVSSATTSAPAPFSELVRTTRTNALGSVKPTFIRTSQAANSSRTPLWMLLSQSSPSRTVNTQLLSTQPKTSAAITPATNTITAFTTSPSLIDENINEPIESEASPTPALVPSTLSVEELPETLVPSLTVSLDDFSAEYESDHPSPVLATHSPSDAIDITPSVTALVSIIPTVGSTESTTSDTPNEILEITPDIDLSKDILSDTLSIDKEFSKSKSPDTSDTILQSLSVARTTEVNSVTAVTGSATWTPVLDPAEDTGQSVSVTLPSTMIPITSNVSPVSPEMTGGFTPIKSNTIQPGILIHTEVWPETNSIPSPTSLTAVDESTATLFALFDASNTMSAPSTSVPDFFTATTVQETGLESDSVMPSEHLFVDEYLISSVIVKDEDESSPVTSPTTFYTSLKDEIELSPIAFPTTIHTSLTDEMDSSHIASPTTIHTSEVELESSVTFPTTIHTSLKDEIESSPFAFPTTIRTSLKDETDSSIDFPMTILTSLENEVTSIPLAPTFTESIPTSSTGSTVSDGESVAEETTHEPTIIVTEKLPSSPTVYIPEILPSSSGKTILATPSTTDIANISSVPSLPTIILESSESAVPHDVPMSSASVATLPTASAGSNLDSRILVAPTATGETTESSTHVIDPEEPPAAEGAEDGTHGELPEKEAAAEIENPSSSSSTISIPAPVMVTTPTYTTSATKKSTTKVTAPRTTSTSPVSTTLSSEVPTFIDPTETTPSLTTMETLLNGTVVKRRLPFIRALVAYSSMEFCQHKNNFRSLFAQWLSRHLHGKVHVEPHDIEFFSKPDCAISKPLTEDRINRNRPQPETDEKLPSLVDNEKTNVYFYVTSAGKINPNLTKQFPLFPMDLEISKNLTYLISKVSQLEVMTAKDDLVGPIITDPLHEKAAAVGTSIIVIIVVCSIVGVTIIVALLFFSCPYVFKMVVKRRGATNNYYGRRCTPVSMDAYSMDSVSVYRSFRRKSKRRASGRSVKSYLNQAFDDPNGPTRLLNFAKLTHFISDIDGVYEEFGTIPVNMPKYDELPSGVEDKNRYANVIPVPETRVLLKQLKDSRNSEYINANYVRGARNESKYYIATQAPLDDTVADFWRMIWEQETKVVVMLTDFVEKGIDKCADYLPPSETLDCHRLYGDFQVTLKSRDMREKFVVSNVQLKNLENNLVREVAHMWFTGWPASGVPNEETAFISFILDVRRTRKKLRAKGPIVIHCSPGTGRTGTLLACDIVMRQFEDQRSVDVPRTVYSIRRDRAGAVQTKEQYAFIYRVINFYASKLTSGNLDSL
nr:mucin-3A-like isoform X2 [Procambarus clarkii]